MIVLGYLSCCFCVIRLCNIFSWYGFDFSVYLVSQLEVENLRSAWRHSYLRRPFSVRLLLIHEGFTCSGSFKLKILLQACLWLVNKPDGPDKILNMIHTLDCEMHYFTQGLWWFTCWFHIKTDVGSFWNWCLLVVLLSAANYIHM
jgi:hypothetical protein